MHQTILQFLVFPKHLTIRWKNVFSCSDNRYAIVWPPNLSFVVALLVFRAQEPKAPVTYCDHTLSVVRRPSVCRPLDYLHFRLLLQNHLMDFDETWYGWSTQGPLQVLLFFGQIRPGRIQGGAKIGHGGSPSSGNFFFRPEGCSNKPNA